MRYTKTVFGVIFTTFTQMIKFAEPVVSREKCGGTERSGISFGYVQRVKTTKNKKNYRR